MLLLTLIFEKNSDAIIRDVFLIKNKYDKKGIKLGIYETAEKDNHFISIYCTDDDVTESFLKNLYYDIGESIYNRIIENYIRKNIVKYLNMKYQTIDVENYRYISKNVIVNLSCKSEGFDDNSIFFLNRKNESIKKISSYLNENKEINIDGIITFRSKEFSREIERVVDRTVEMFVTEQEYEEFIKLLKYFIEVTESRIDTLNILIDLDGEYYLKNNNNEDVMEELLNELVDEDVLSGANREDLIMSILIANSPEKIIIHNNINASNKEFIKTLTRVFEDRVKFCNLCMFCKEFNSEFSLDSNKSKEYNYSSIKNCEEEK